MVKTDKSSKSIILFPCEILKRYNHGFSYADIIKSTKQERTETEESVRDCDHNGSSLKDPSTEDAMVPVSPSYMSEASDAFATSYNSMSKVYKFQ